MALFKQRRQVVDKLAYPVTEWPPMLMRHKPITWLHIHRPVLNGWSAVTHLRVSAPWK